IAVDGNYTYIGGNFTYVGFNTGNGVKLTTTNSNHDLNYVKVNGTIETCISDGSGGWYIGGSFTKVGSLERNRIAHINSNGSVNENWNPNSNGTIYIIVVSGN